MVIADSLLPPDLGRSTGLHMYKYTHKEITEIIKAHIKFEIRGQQQKLKFINS